MQDGGDPLMRFLWGMVLGVILTPFSVWGVEEYTVISDLGTSAQMIGLGRFGGFSDTADVIFENPAGLARIKSMGVGFFSSQVIDATYRGVSVAMRTGAGVVGLGYYGSSISGLIYTGQYSSGQGPGPEFSVSESVFRAGLQSNISPEVSAGVAAVVVSKDLGSDSVVAGNLEAGIFQDLDRFSYSIVVRNILPMEAVYRSGATEKQSFQVIPSLWVPLDPFTLVGQMRWIYGVQPTTLNSLGIKWAIISDCFSVVAGGAEMMTTTGKKTSRMSVGTVLSMSSVTLQYSYEKGDYEDDGNHHYFSIGVGL